MSNNNPPPQGGSVPDALKAPLRIGTRGSRLARWQAEWVAQELRAIHPGLAIELVEIKTLGDRDRESPLAALGQVGIFTREIQNALLDRRVDVAVHSLKDLPTIGATELTLAAVPARETTADALIAPTYQTLAALPNGAKVGTSALRRAAQLRHLRPDLEIHPIRGNIETRLRHALDGRLDAIVLAEAGLRRLRLDAHITERLEPPRFLPAVGQGALGIECRANDSAVSTLLAPLNHPVTQRAVVAERALLAALGGGCLIPLGALAIVDGSALSIDAALLDQAGTTCLRASFRDASDPIALGQRAAKWLLEQGAQALLDALRAAPSDIPSNA